MMTRIFLILLSLGILSTLEGCYVVDPYPDDDRPFQIAWAYCSSDLIIFPGYSLPI